MGISLGYLWDMFGISLGYIWDIFGISLGYLWDMFGMYGISLGISLGYLWDIFGISSGYLWDIFRRSVPPEFLRSFFGAHLDVTFCALVFRELTTELVLNFNLSRAQHLQIPKLVECS